MDTRRDFLKKAALLAGTAPYWDLLPDSIRTALAIDPATGSTYLDAEHVVILMQENRSFDHAYGSLQGVRGFDDPRAIELPGGHPVWCQRNEKGDTFAPFRLHMQDSKATWMSSLPHTWPDQVDARNGGKHDGWLDAKRSHVEDYAHLPLTLGYYNRADLPFYYALADAFTICDQNFCSSLTGTTPNRLYLWTGTIREQPHPEVKANVRNEDVDYDHIASWKTFPERLEELGVSWKIYQNELSLNVGFDGEQEEWLSNFGDNPLEWFEQYHAKFSSAYYQYLQKLPALLEADIRVLQLMADHVSPTSAEAKNMLSQIREKQTALAMAEKELNIWTPERFAQLSAREKALFEKAFTTNQNDPDYHSLSTLAFQENGQERQMSLPKGDVLHQFRSDVQNQALPAVSWIVAPQNFSDHPSAPWYGAWYVSEVMNVLTQNPKVWEKTIFILAYDENDGYFDHCPPFVPPHPDQPSSGMVSRSIDAREEFVHLDQESEQGKYARQGPIGLGYRVPLLIASPWSRGGRVCSEVFDHTSVLQFLEHFLQHKTGREVRETNISSWRRAICGNLSSVFRPYNGEQYKLPDSLVRNELVESIYQAQFKPPPNGYKALTEQDVALISQRKAGARQEKGRRPSCALPYELYVDGQLTADRSAFEINFVAGQTVFGPQSLGAPFQVYVPEPLLVPNQPTLTYDTGSSRNYAVLPGDSLWDSWSLADFAKSGTYHFRVHGPNGFFREFIGSENDPGLEVLCAYQRRNAHTLSGKLEIRVRNTGQEICHLEIADRAYQYSARRKKLAAGKSMTFTFHLKDSHRWYDFSVRAEGFPTFEKRYAGRIETGEEGFTDPLIGG